MAVDDSDLLSQLGSGPPPGASTTDTTSRNYIGPNGYQLPDTYNAGTSPQQAVSNLFSGGLFTGRPVQPSVIPPRYSFGDEFAPISESWSPDRIASFQRELVTAGLLKPRDFQLGFWDKASMNAYKELLGYANVAGKDYTTTLANFKSTLSQFGDTTSTGKVRQPFLAQVSDPAKLQDTLDAVSVRTMGRGLSPDEKAAFVKSYQDMQTTAQRQEYDLKGDYDPNTGAYTGTGGTVTVPDEQAQANKYIKDTHPDDVKVYNALQSFKAFDELLSSSRVS